MLFDLPVGTPAVAFGVPAAHGLEMVLPSTRERGSARSLRAPNAQYMVPGILSS